MKNKLFSDWEMKGFSSNRNASTKSHWNRVRKYKNTDTTWSVFYILLKKDYLKYGISKNCAAYRKDSNDQILFEKVYFNSGLASVIENHIKSGKKVTNKAQKDGHRWAGNTETMEATSANAKWLLKKIKEVEKIAENLKSWNMKKAETIQNDLD